MRILAIESSCDDTGVAIYETDNNLIWNKTISQMNTHILFKGIVPEIVCRDHQQCLLPMIDAAISNLGHNKYLDAIAYTKGPGLVGALLIGATIAKSLSFAFKLPVIGIHHLEGHMLAIMLEKDKPNWPFLTLLVSGGHTILVLAQNPGIYRILGCTRDDAAGEAFDKTAKLLEISGGMQLASLADSVNKSRFTLSRTMLRSKDLDFSFSGLKTNVARLIKQVGLKDKAEIAWEFQQAVVDSLLIKLKKAINLYPQCKAVVIAGGVAANNCLRFNAKILTDKLNIPLHLPRPEFCVDNAAMIAYTAYSRLQSNQHDLNWKIDVNPRWSLSSLEKF
eukprot:GHVL01044176.1.p1 GENE.GHVL01044176.1~~GHVL01044176.1.p1  ORF type:complete len:335 (+),score=36.79 GHVL01044176.1:1449-2453(+)